MKRKNDEIRALSQNHKVRFGFVLVGITAFFVICWGIARMIQLYWFAIEFAPFGNPPLSFKMFIFALMTMGIYIVVAFVVFVGLYIFVEWLWKETRPKGFEA